MKIAIQGELGSNSHMAALAMLDDLADSAEGGVEIVPCAVSVAVFERVLDGSVDGGVLPIENTLYGSVSEHYDLLLAKPVRIVGEGLLHVRHNLIVAPGVRLEEVRRVLSHPVALSQCRGWLAAHPEIEVINFYDTAGSVKHLMAEGLRDTAGVAPRLAAEQYGAQVLVAGIEDHAENFTRFHLLVADSAGKADQGMGQGSAGANKASLAFTVAHRPGTLVAALDEFARAGLNLTKIESRPVPGAPWEYVFFADLRFDSEDAMDSAIHALGQHCPMIKEMGRYTAAK